MNVTNCNTDVKEKRNYLPPDTKYTKLQPNNILSGIPAKRLSANAGNQWREKIVFLPACTAYLFFHNNNRLIFNLLLIDKLG